MPACSVSCCKNRSENTKEKNIRFFSFPRDPNFAEKWKEACGREVNTKNGRVCSIHFTAQSYKEKPAYLKNCENYSPKTVRSLLDTAMPTEYLFWKNVNKKSVQSSNPNQLSLSSCKVTTCAAVGCSNSSNKGYTMKCFPRDPKKRKQWANQVNRDNWYPSNLSSLCEVHFAPEMWEKRADGKKKLKNNAVPTIFPGPTKLTKKLPRKYPVTKRVRANKKNTDKDNKKDWSLQSIDELEDVLRQSPSPENSSSNMLNRKTRKRKIAQSQQTNSKIKKVSEDHSELYQDYNFNPTDSDHCYAICNNLDFENDPSERDGQQIKVEFGTLTPNNGINNLPALSVSSRKSTKNLHLILTLDKNLKESLDQQQNKTTNKLRPLLPKGSIIFTENEKTEPTDPAPNFHSSTTYTRTDLDKSINSGPTLKPPDGQLLLGTATSDFKKLLLYEKLCQRQRNTITSYRNKLRNAQRRIKNLEDQLKELPDREPDIREIFNKDQMMALQKKTMSKSTRFMKWSDATIFKALRLKFACGAAGYEELLKQNLPLPSEKTLRRRLQNVKFEPGILDQVFEFLKVKIDCLNNNEKNCCLILEEMEIVPEITFDPKSDSHVQIFILAGINGGWKQIVAFYFIEDSIEDDHVFKELFEIVLRKTKDINLNIISITSDIEASNQTIWESLNMNFGRHKTIKNTIMHPLEEMQKVYIFADVPKLFNQIKSMFKTNKTITIPEYIKEKHKLPTNIISASHIIKLISLQAASRFRLVPKATMTDLLPLDFDKAATFSPKSKNVQNLDISSALKLVAKLHIRPHYVATAWFIDVLEKWFDIMTSKSPVSALSKCNQETYRETVSFLYDFMEIIDSMEVGDQKVWRTTQTGALISTKSMLQIQRFLLHQKGYSFLLTSRFSSNYLENFRDSLKTKELLVNAVNVQENLKIITIAQYLQCPKSTCFDENHEAMFQRSFLSKSRRKNNNHKREQLEENHEETIEEENSCNSIEQEEEEICDEDVKEEEEDIIEELNIVYIKEEEYSDE